MSTSGHISHEAIRDDQVSRIALPQDVNSEAYRLLMHVPELAEGSVTVLQLVKGPYGSTERLGPRRIWTILEEACRRNLACKAPPAVLSPGTESFDRRASEYFSA